MDPTDMMAQALMPQQGQNQAYQQQMAPYNQSMGPNNGMNPFGGATNMHPSASTGGGMLNPAAGGLLQQLLQGHPVGQGVGAPTDPGQFQPGTQSDPNLPPVTGGY